MCNFKSMAIELFAETYYSNICTEKQQISIISRVSSKSPTKGTSYFGDNNAKIREFKRILKSAISNDEEIIKLWAIVINDTLTEDDYQFGSRPEFNDEIKIKFLNLLKEHLKNKRNKIITLVAKEKQFERRDELDYFNNQLKLLQEEYIQSLQLLKYIEPNEEKKELIGLVESTGDKLDDFEIQSPEIKQKCKENLAKLLEVEREEIKNNSSFTKEFKSNLNSAFVSLGLNTLYNTIMNVVKALF